jgi:hypothetical protein
MMKRPPLTGGQKGTLRRRRLADRRRLRTGARLAAAPRLPLQTAGR